MSEFHDPMGLMKAQMMREIKKLKMRSDDLKFIIRCGQKQPVAYRFSGGVGPLARACTRRRNHDFMVFMVPANMPSTGHIVCWMFASVCWVCHTTADTQVCSGVPLTLSPPGQLTWTATLDRGILRSSFLVSQELP
jgi:hypothetical protein